MSQMIPNTTCLSTKSTLFSILKMISIKKNVKKNNLEFIVPVWKWNEAWGHGHVITMLMSHLGKQQDPKADNTPMVQDWFLAKTKNPRTKKCLVFFLLAKTKNQSSSQKMLHENPTRHKLFKTWHDTKGDEGCLYLRTQVKPIRGGILVNETQVEMI